MILLLNCLITDDVFSIYDRGRLCDNRKIDVFKYMLTSIAPINFQKSYINISVAEEYRSEEEDLFAFIKSLFPNAQIRKKRLDRYAEWLEFIQEHDLGGHDQPIFIACNDDHIFVAHDTQRLNSLLSAYQSLVKGEDLISIRYTHWPESRRYTAQMGTVTENDEYEISFGKDSHDGIQIVSPNLLRKWFYADSSHLKPDWLVRRTEDLGRPIGDVLRITPKSELFRHFDAYSHAGISIRDCSPLTIPVGFFEKKLKLCFANILSQDEAERLITEGYTVCSPGTVLLGNLLLQHPVYPYTPDTIPMFWEIEAPEVRYYGHYQHEFNTLCQTYLIEKASLDPNHPHDYQIGLNSRGNYTVNKMNQWHSTMPYMGFHKTAAQPSKKSIFLLQDLKKFDKDSLKLAIDNFAERLATSDISVHLVLITPSTFILSGSLSIMLNKLLGDTHQSIASLTTLNCTQDLSSVDVLKFIYRFYQDTKIILAHNAEPIDVLTIADEIFTNHCDEFFDQSPTPITFISAGIRNYVGTSSLLMLAATDNLDLPYLPLPSASLTGGGNDVVASTMNGLFKAKSKAYRHIDLTT